MRPLTANRHCPCWPKPCQAPGGAPVMMARNRQRRNYQILGCSLGKVLVCAKFLKARAGKLTHALSEVDCAFLGFWSRQEKFCRQHCVGDWFSNRSTIAPAVIRAKSTSLRPPPFSFSSDRTPGAGCASAAIRFWMPPAPRVAVIRLSAFLFFHKRLCGPLANSRFHHQPHPSHQPDSKLEAAYHRR